jgi:hypothetical protein
MAWSDPMDKIIESGSVAGLLAAITVMIGLNLVVEIGKTLWRIREKRDAVTESGIDKLSKAVDLNTAASQQLENRIKTLELTLTDISKIKIDLRRLYMAVKIMSGDSWETIRKKIMDDEVI